MTTKEAAPRRLTVTEALDLRLLPDEGLSYDEDLEAVWLDAQLAAADDTEETAVKTRGVGHATIAVEPLGPVVTRPPIRVRGHLAVPVTTTCVRCLSPVEEALAVDLDLTLLASDAEIAQERGEDGELLDESTLDEGAYEGNAIDLPSILREALLLEVSMNPVCEDEAACTARTDALLTDANREATEVEVDDRWAALRRLRDQVATPDEGQGEGNQG